MPLIAQADPLGPFVIVLVVLIGMAPPVVTLGPLREFAPAMGQAQRTPAVTMA